MQATGDILAVQQILGHQDIRHTMIYAHTTTQYLQDAIERLPLRVTDLSPELSPAEAAENDAAPKSLHPGQFEVVGAAGIEPATSTV